MDPPSSGPLTSTFTQQGTVDWGRIGTGCISYTLDVLSRLAATNVQAMTMEVGAVICHQFNLSTSGRANVRQALLSLPSHRSVGNALWFGFGIKHVTRILVTTNEGSNCLAICAALAEFYIEDIGAEVMYELVKSLGAPPQFTPSVLQWAELVRSCSGVLASTEFGLLIGDFQKRIPPRDTGDWNCVPRIATPKSIAEALQGIGDVSRGETSVITITGGAEIFWIAAICQWLLDLRFEIQELNTTVHSNTGDQQAQVVLVYQDELDSEELDLSASALQIVRKTYVLKPRETTSMIKCRPQQYILTGRTQWETAFGSVFHEDFDYLMQHESQTLGTAIGYGARILQSLVPTQKRTLIAQFWDMHNSSSSGREFIDFIVERFPEFRSLKKTMIAAASTSAQNATVGYESRVADLVLRCSCPNCRVQSKPEDNYHRFCRPSILETVMSVALALSETSVFPGLHLKKGGILETYHNQFQRRQEWTESQRRDPAVGNWPLDGKSPEQDWHCSELGVFGLITCGLQSGLDAKMDRCFSLFTASGGPSQEGIAASQNGICCYLGILEDGLSDDPNECLLVHIVPGSIEHNNKPFDFIASDEEESGNEVLGTMSPSSLLQRVTSYTKTETYLAESLRGLQLHFRIGADQDPSLQWVKVVPSLFLRAVVRAKGWVKCLNNDCEQFCKVPEGSNVVCKFGRKDIQLVEGNKLIRSAALVLAELEESVYLLRKTECVQCCIRWGTAGSISEYYWGDANAVEAIAHMKLVVISRPKNRRALAS